jgi:hypothetical protein
MPTNAERQRRGEACIRHWKWCAGEAPNTELGEEDAVDLVTDIFHYCAVRGFDIDAMVRMAKGNCEAEIREEAEAIPE